MTLTPTPTHQAAIDTLLSVRPAHQTRRMSFPVDPDTTRRLRKVIGQTRDGDTGLRWWTKLVRWLRLRR